MTQRKQIEGIVSRMRALATDAIRHRDGAVSAERVRTWARELETVLKQDDAETETYPNGCPILE